MSCFFVPFIDVQGIWTSIEHSFHVKIMYTLDSKLNVDTTLASLKCLPICPIYICKGYLDIYGAFISGFFVCLVLNDASTLLGH